jgi:lipopolysaccharide export system protein LptA
MSRRTTTSTLVEEDRGAELARRLLPGLLLALALSLALALPGGIGAAMAQPLDLTQGGPITVTARDGIEWHQTEQEVIALGDARAVRGNVTVTADRLIAYYRKKAQPDVATTGAPGGAQTGGAHTGGTQTGAARTGSAHPGAPAPGAVAQPAAVHTVAAQGATSQPGEAQSGIAGDTDTAGTEIYRLRAEGHVQIFTPTDHAQGDLAVYDIDQAVLVMTGHNLRLTTPNDVLTSRDTMEYWPQKHMAVARGNAVVVTKDARRVAADVLVAYTTDTSAPGASPGAAHGAAPPKPTPPPKTTAGSPSGSGDDLTASGKLEKVEAFGHVSVRTPTDTATGDRAVYVPESGIARLADNVHITRGENQLDGQQGEVNMKTGIARLLSGSADRVTGLVVPNDATNRALSNAAPPAADATPARAPSAIVSPTGKSSAGSSSVGSSSAGNSSTGTSTDGSPAAGKPVGGNP